MFKNSGSAFRHIYTFKRHVPRFLFIPSNKSIYRFYLQPIGAVFHGTHSCSQPGLSHTGTHTPPFRQMLFLKFGCGSLFSGGQIIGRNWYKGFPPCYSQSPLLSDFTPPRFDRKWFETSLQCQDCTRKPQVWKLSSFCPETSLKLYFHEFGFRSLFFGTFKLSICEDTVIFHFISYLILFLFLP